MDITRNHYREVLSALESGPKSSQQIHRQVGFTDVDHTSAILAKLSSHRYITKAYVITEEGKRVLHPEPEQTDWGPKSDVPREATLIFRTGPAKKPFSIKLVGGLPSVVRDND